ncbi:LysR family transcriptional regulator [Moritella sp. Urea-trap-13]|uniref:LysR family transcriptional regulator n=1 Tax=Moritella sp. Urea-trap-13 TaxID=2058327 RepID=UPI000C33B33A|nr:LysR family transcriptional regulator [Moritella sp. Urea-trap-13]PKH07443.1 LysR family transcriptional regulator [Moritella sp. Urea-trap-13]
MNENNIAKVDFNLLKSLQALLAEQHVGRAAKKMNVSQSAMSHTLTRLRDTFDDRLFIRHAKGLEPTVRALELADKLDFILNEIDGLFAPASLELAQIHARFRIQTHDFIVAAYLAKAIRAINTEAPHVIMDIQMMSQTGYDDLDIGKLDMIIGTGVKAKPRFMQKRLTDETVVCLLDKDNPVLHSWNAESLFQCSHIKSSLLDEQHDSVSQFGITAGMPARKIGLYAETLNLQLALLANTQLISFLPQSMAVQGQTLYGLAVKACPFPLPKVTIRGVWHERHQNDLLHKWVRDKISDAFVSA